MIRDFSEEKKEEIFRILDEIDMKEWKPFMEWCGNRVEEFGDWPEKLNVSAYTRYVDEYHNKVLEINEMTRQQVNTVFENVAEINARYAGRMKECQVKIKEQIAMVNTMTEFMQSMTDGNPNMALLTNGSMNENSTRTVKGVELKDIMSDKLPDRKVIKHILEKANGNLSNLSLGEMGKAISALKILVSASYKGEKEEKEYTRDDIGDLWMLFKDEDAVWETILGVILSSCAIFLSQFSIVDYRIGMFILAHASRTKSEESDYVGVYYLNKEDGAFGQGHAALLFVREDRSGVFYSFAGNIDEAGSIALTLDVTGYLSRTELTAEEVGVFFAGPTMEEYLNNTDEENMVDFDKEYNHTESRKNECIVPCQGVIFTDYMRIYHYDGGEGAPYNRTIYIPLSDEQGDRMVDLAEELRRNTPDYNLLEYNCNMAAQQILAEGNVDFAVASGSAWDERIIIRDKIVYVCTGNIMGNFATDYLIHDELSNDETIPNVAYAHGEEMAEESGYSYGSLDEVYREVNEGSINRNEEDGE